MTELQLTTNPGLESIALDELHRLCASLDLTVLEAESRPDGMGGHLRIVIDAPWDRVRPLCALPRSVHRIVRTVHRFTLGPEPLDQVREVVAELAPSIPELSPEDVTFRATTKRVGTHDFSSEDVARATGAGVRQALMRTVKLKGFDVEIRCDVRQKQVALGVTVAHLSHRSHGRYSQRTSLRANAAWALLELARPDPDEPPRRLLDPFCGAGTILVEAGRRWPDTELYGVDRLEVAAKGTAENLLHAGFADRSHTQVGDARHLDELGDLRFDTIVGNPPFGTRLGKSLDLQSFYTKALWSAAEVATEDARLVWLVQKRGAFNRAVDRSPWKRRFVQVFELGGLYVGAFVLDLDR